MHKRTIALDFSKSVKAAVSKRDEFDGWPCCINCGRPAPEKAAWSNAHFVPRSHGGLGIEENGLTLCPECHRRYDQSAERERMREYFRDYLQENYPDWSEEKLYYKGDKNA